MSITLDSVPRTSVKVPVAGSTEDTVYPWTPEHGGYMSSRRVDSQTRWQSGYSAVPRIPPATATGSLAP